MYVHYQVRNFKKRSRDARARAVGFGDPEAGLRPERYFPGIRVPEQHCIQFGLAFFSNPRVIRLPSHVAETHSLRPEQTSLVLRTLLALAKFCYFLGSQSKFENKQPKHHETSFCSYRSCRRRHLFRGCPRRRDSFPPPRSGALRKMMQCVAVVAVGRLFLTEVSWSLSLSQFLSIINKGHEQQEYTRADRNAIGQPVREPVCNAVG